VEREYPGPTRGDQTQIDRQTDHICSNRLHLRHCVHATWPNNTNENANVHMTQTSYLEPSARRTCMLVDGCAASKSAGESFEKPKPEDTVAAAAAAGEEAAGIDKTTD